MIDLTDLLDEFALRVAQVEVSNTTIQELTRETAEGDHSHIGITCLGSEFVSREEFLSGQRLWEETNQHSGLRILLGLSLQLCLSLLLGIGNIGLIGSLQFLRNGIATVLHTIEQRDHIGVVHITRTRTTCDEVVRGDTIERHILHVLSEGQCLLVLHEYHTLGSRLTSHL